MLRSTTRLARASLFGSVSLIGLTLGQAFAAVIDYPTASTRGTPIVLTDGSTQLQVLTGSATQSGIISESGGSFGLEKVGAGTLTLSAANTYTGSTTVSSGTLALGAGTGSLAATSALVINGGTFNLGNNVQTVQALSGSGGTLALGTGQLTIAGNANTTFRGAITATAGKVVKTGSGTLVYAGNGIFTGLFTVNNGALQLGDDSGPGNVQNVVLNNASLVLVQGVVLQHVTGTGTIVKNGNDVAALGGRVAATIGVTVNSGTLLVAPGGRDRAVIFGNVVNNAELVINGLSPGDLYFLDNQTSGSGNLTLHLGVFLIRGNNSYTGTTTLRFTRATIGDGLITGGSGVAGSLGTGGIVLDSSSLIFARNDTYVVPGGISGNGNVTQSGGGTTILAGANTYINSDPAIPTATTITAGTLQIGNGGTSGSLAGDVANNGVLAFNRSDASTYAGVISGTGSVNKMGAGTLSLSGANTYTGGTMISGGTLQIGSGGTTGSITGNVINNGVLAINRSDEITFGNVISGTGSLSQTGSGTTVLTGANTYSGGTNVSAGVLRLGAGGSVGTGPITVTGGTFDAGNQTLNANNLVGTGGAIHFGSGGLLFDISGSQTVGSALAGSGGIVKSGIGTLILSGNNSFSGGITIAGGTVSLGNNNAAGLGAITTTGSVIDYADGVIIANPIAVNSDTTRLQAVAGVTATQSGAISQIVGARPLEKIGAGKVVLTGANAYTGRTTVSGGVLRVNGSIAASSGVTVASGATLGGSGTVSSTTVQSGGTLAPGNSIGTLTVNGNLTLNAGSIYAVELSPTASDLTIVTGTASLNGTVAVSPVAGSYTYGTNLILLSASNITGTFANVTGLAFAGFRPELSYGATSVSLRLLPDFQGVTANQIAAAAALNAGTGALQNALGNYVVANPSQMADMLGSVSGEIHAALRSAAFEDGRMIRGAVLTHLASRPAGTVVWAQAFADSGRIDADGNAAGIHRNNAGFVAGFDMDVTDGLRLGVGGAYMENRLNVNAQASRASGARGSILAYANYEAAGFAVRLGGDYGWGNTDIVRAVAALGETETSRRNSGAGSLFAQASYDLGLPVLPYVGVTHVTAGNGAFAETGGMAALSGGAATDDQTYSLLGVRAALESLDLYGMALTPRADLAWSHAFSPAAPGQTVALANSQNFVVLGAPIGEDAAAIQLGLDLQLMPQALFSVGYDGFFSDRAQSHAIRAGIHWRL